jgi:ribosomal protein S18 acetylase RimI-like enzyme
MKHIKLFENFSRDYVKANNNSLAAFYTEQLGDFWLEKDLLEKLELFEAKIDSIFSDSWNLNRGRNQYNGDFFALNVKVYNSPDNEEVLAKVGIELDEERLSDIWYRWLQDQAEMFQEDIEQSYDWVGHVGWGGNSGGWLHLSPDNGADRLLEYAEETIQMYLDTKEWYEEDVIADVAKAINSAEWKRLAELGLVEDDDAVKEITDKLTEAIKWFKDETAKLDQIEEDLKDIQRQHREFEQNAKQYFLDFLEEEVADGHLFENQSQLVIKTEGDIQANPGIKISLVDNGEEVGTVSLLNLIDSNSNDFDPDLVEFLDKDSGPFTSDNTYYLHGMGITPAYRGKGLSKNLLQKCHEIAKAAGIANILLITNCDNVVAQNLYAGFGYRPCDSTGIKDLLVKSLT